MEPLQYVKGVVEKMPNIDFLKLALQKMDEIEVSTEEDLILLDKVAYKSSTISRDFKLKMLTPELRENFIQTMNEMKLDEKEFLGSMEFSEGGREISSSSKDSKEILSGSKDSVIKVENLQEGINDLKRRMNFVDTEEKSPKPVKVSKPSKFSFTIKKTQGAMKNSLMQDPSSEDPHIESRDKPLEPGSERENKYSERKDPEYRWEKIETRSDRSRAREPRSERKYHLEGSSRVREHMEKGGLFVVKFPKSHWEKMNEESHWEKEERQSSWAKDNGAVSIWENEDGVVTRWEKNDGVSKCRWEKVDKVDSKFDWEKEDSLEKEDQDFRDDPQLHSFQGIHRSRKYKPPLPNQLF